MVLGLFGGDNKKPWQYNTIYCTNTSAHKNSTSYVATVLCTKCNMYLCSHCDSKLHTKKDQSHKPYVVPTDPLRAYVVLQPQPDKDDSHIRRHLKYPGGPETFPWRFLGCSTLYETFDRSAKMYANERMLGTRTYDVATRQAGPYQWQTYKVVYDRCNRLQSGLLQLGLNPHDCVGIYSINRAEWTITEYASYMQSLVPVPLYDTLGLDTAEYIIKQAEIKVVVCSHDKVPTLLKIAESNDTPLRAIVVMPLQAFDPPVPADKLVKPGTKVNNTTVYSFGDVELMGMRKAAKHTPPKPDDLMTLCYTSGTTGMPKGVELTHKNIIANVAGIEAHTDNAGTFNHEDVSISYLPLPHIMERCNQSSILAHGGSQGYFRGSPLLLVEDAEALKPTIFAGPPRLYNRLYDAVSSAIDQQGGIKAALYYRGFEAKKQRYERYGDFTHPFWDRLVFKKVAARLGGRVRLFVTGSAPISDDCKTFLRLAFSCRVIEGYGLTETSSGTTLAGWDDDRTNGNVGIPFVQSEIKLRSVPEMNYTVNDIINNVHQPRGEVCIRGLSVFRGYYKNPEKTREDKSDDGWFYTGDIGQFLPNGALRIIDRKKNIFKLAQGEYIAAEKIENIYARCRYVAQNFVYGDSLKSCLVGIVVPDEANLKQFAIKQGLAKDSTSFEELCKNPKIKDLVLKELNATATEYKLHTFEKVKDIHLTHELFSPENGILTPTQKLQRNNAKKVFQQVIDDMYKKIDAQGDSKKGGFIGSKL